LDFSILQNSNPLEAHDPYYFHLHITLIHPPTHSRMDSPSLCTFLRLISSKGVGSMELKPGR
ncbi:MAG TPA: hypothetical protein PKZ03_06855, partial [Methanothrix sp.]|nr:hypothetical protein [Methanothrix sp.]